MSPTSPAAAPASRRRPALRRAFSLALLLPALSIALSDLARAQSPLAPVWSGVYAGVHGGGNWHDITTSNGGSLSEQSVGFGGHLGLNLGLGLVVIGVEADVGIDTASGHNALPLPGFVTGAEVNASGTLRGRLGIPVGPVLFYATAGYAWTDLEITVGTAAGSASRSASFDGIVYGGGAEVAVLPRLALRIEALHFDYSESTLDLGALGRSIDSFDPSTTVVRAGISFRLN